MKIKLCKKLPYEDDNVMIHSYQDGDIIFVSSELKKLMVAKTVKETRYRITAKGYEPVS
jgi:hypothetical protein